VYLTFYCDFWHWLIQINYKMRTKFSGILTLLLVLVVQLTFAQEKTISGTVTDNSGLPLPGVNIIVKGTTNGTQSDFDGNYSIQAAGGQTLSFSYVGFKTGEVAVTASSSRINFSMEEDAAQLEEVVVTASGIRKEKKALGYAVSSIKEESIKNNPESDLTRVLQGKTAGINITTQNGLSGSANKVIIRGMNSFSGSNNALYVIDGVPMSNDTNEAGSFVDGNMGSSRSFDIDPSNIANIDILKGLAATTLYGTEGRNGVILITTKTGSSKSLSAKQEIEISSSYFFNEVASLPDYQDSFGGGFNQADADGWFYSNWGPGFYRDGLGGWGTFINDDDDDAGFNSDGTLAHPYSTSSFLGGLSGVDAVWAEQFQGQRYEWKPRNSVKEFFNVGGVSTLSANIRGRSEDSKYNYGMAFGHLNDKGFTPGNEVTRTNLTISGGGKLSNKINAKGSLNYTLTNLKTPPVSTSFGSSSIGAGSSIFGDLFYTPRGIDIQELPFQLPSGGSIYYRDDNAIQHPLWTVNNSRFTQKVNRINGYAAIDFNVTEKINLLYQASLDNYTEENVNRQNRGGVTGSILIDDGFYNTYSVTNTIFDHKFVISGNNFATFNDHLNIGFLAGATSRGTYFDRQGIFSSGQLVYDFFDHSGFTSSTSNVDFDDDDEIDLGIELHRKRNILGLYGQLSLDVDNYLFFNFAGRNDWVSNSNNNSLFYPSASVSFIPTSAFPSIKSDKGISYLKLRVGYGTSANFATGYPTVTAVVLGTVGNSPSNSTSDTVGNPDILPELFEEIEYGIEGKLFGRVNFDVSYYTRTTNDLIVLDRPIPPSSGASFTDSNIGKIESDGIEVDLGINILKSDNGLNWNFNWNFNKSESEVIELSPDSQLIIYEGFTTLGNGARVGFPLGTIFGSRVARDDEGNLLVDGVGNYVSEDADEEGLLPAIGDPNPDWVMNYTNTISYRGLSLGVSVGHTSGGDIYSVTVASLMGRGLTTDTEDRLGTYILPGVSQTTGLPNDIQINNSDFYFSNGFASPADELSVYDGSVIRLREVSLGYTLPSRFLEKTPIGKLVIKASGYNMWYDAYNTPDGINFDPNVSGLGAGNGQGFDFLTGPSSKRYGLSINATF